MPWDGPGQPAAWVTHEPVPQPGPVWSALSGLHAGTGLVPVLLADDADPDYDFGFAVPCDPAEIDQVDPVQILAPRWDGWMADQAEAARGPHGPWPTPRTTEFLGLEPRADGGPALDGIAMAVLRAATDPAASAELSRRSEPDRRNASWPSAGDATGRRRGSAPGWACPAVPGPGAVLGRQPDQRRAGPCPRHAAGPPGSGWSRRPAPLMSWPWSAGSPSAIRLTRTASATRCGSGPCSAPGRTGSAPGCLTIGPGAEIQLLVDRPPRTREAAEQIAVEHCVFCDECAGQGLGSVPEVAAAILDAPIWTFWWD